MRNAMSIDVEDWFHPEALQDTLQNAERESFEPRAAQVVDRLLALLAEKRVRATFFVLGWIAERDPSLVPRIAAAGHEIGSHGYGHAMITQQSQSEFADDLARSLRVLRAQSGQQVIGYRAPSFSIVRSTLWALDILLEQGIEYDASVFPVHHDRYGIPGAPRSPYRIARRGTQELWELPPATYQLMGRTLPAAGGGYLRLLPYGFTAAALRQLNRAQKPAIVYTHPWEYDVEQPRVALPRLRAFRHYGRISTTENKLARLLVEFEFGTCREVYEAARNAARPAPVLWNAPSTPAVEPITVGEAR